MRTCVLLLGLLLCGGCFFRPGGGSYPISARSGEEEIDGGRILWHELNGKVWISLYFDIPMSDTDVGLGGSSGNYDSSTGKVTFSDKRVAKDGRVFDINATTMYGSGGSVVVNGQSYNLMNGSIFLISTKKKLSVTQVDADLSQFQPTRANFDALAVKYPALQDFLSRIRVQIQPAVPKSRPRTQGE